MGIKINISLLSRAIVMLNYLWSYREFTPVDNDKELRELIDSLEKLRRKHGSIADRLQAAIEKSDFSVSQLAKDCDIPNSTLNGWLTGSIPTDFDAVERLASRLGVGFQYLLTGKESDDE